MNERTSPHATLQEALRRCAEYHGDDALLDAPCIFCGYNGAGYWQTETHSADCRWYRVGGFHERRSALMTQSHPSTETRNEPMRDALQRLVAAVDDMEGMDEADGVEFHTAESVLESALLNARESLKNAAPQGNAVTGPAANDKPDISHQQRYGCESTDSPPAVAAPQSLSSSTAAMLPTDPFLRLAGLIEEIKADRYGQPLKAALHLCNDLADELTRARSAIGGKDKP